MRGVLLLRRFSKPESRAHVSAEPMMRPVQPAIFRIGIIFCLFVSDSFFVAVILFAFLVLCAFLHYMFSQSLCLVSGGAASL